MKSLSCPRLVQVTSLLKPSVEFLTVKPPLLANLDSGELALFRHVVNLVVAHLQVFGHLFDGHPFGHAAILRFGAYPNISRGIIMLRAVLVKSNLGAEE